MTALGRAGGVDIAFVGSSVVRSGFDPDVVIAGSFTNAFTRALLARLGYTVVELEPETAIADVKDNLRRVATAIGRIDRGEQLVGEIVAESRRLDAGRTARAPTAVVVRPGGFTVGDHSFAQDLMTLAGVRNVAAEQGLGALGFTFAEPEETKAWVDEYYDIITSDRCVPAGFAINPNIALALPMMVHADEAQAITGQVLHVWGGAVNVLRGWSAGELLDSPDGWEPDALLGELLARFPEGASPPGMLAGMQAAGGRSLQAAD